MVGHRRGGEGRGSEESGWWKRGRDELYNYMYQNSLYMYVFIRSAQGSQAALLESRHQLDRWITVHEMSSLLAYTVEYCQSAPPYFHARMARKGGGINGSDRFCTRGEPPILISAPPP